MNKEYFRKLMKSGNFGQAVIWNMAGICFYHFCRWMISISVFRMSEDFTTAGLLALAISITSIWGVVAFYSVRNVQVSDTEGRHTDSEYVSTRIVTIIIAVIFCVIHALIFTRDAYQALVISVYMLLVAGAAYADVMHGILQKQWRMDIIGISFAVKGFGIIALFVLLFHFFGFLPAIIGITLFYTAIIFLFDEKYARRYTDLRISFDSGRILPLLKLCFPLVICSFVAFIIPSVTRMVLQRMTDGETLGIFAAATVPASIIQMVVISSFPPFVNAFKKHLLERNYRKYLRLFWFGILGIIAIFAAFYALTLPFGEWLMWLLYRNDEMVPYTYLFTEAAIVSFLTCLCLFITLPLVVLRYIYTQIFIYLGGVAVFVVFLRTMILDFGMSGANYIQILAYALISAAMLFAAIIVSKKEFAERKQSV